MDRKRIMKLMEKTYKRLVLYSKKSKMMGLYGKELNEYIDMMVKYIKLKMMLNDSIFDDFIMPVILYEEALELFEEVTNELGWYGELLVEDDSIDKVSENFNQIKNKKKLIKKINELELLLLDNLNNLYKETEDKEMFREISLLLSEGTDFKFEVIIEHLSKKFEMVMKVLDIEEER